MWVNPEKGFGFLKSPGNPTDHFRLSDAPPQIAKFDLVKFNSLPKDGSKHPQAVNLEIVIQERIAA
jgi:hypothetical protein